jgi:hypothetical protein
MVPQLCTRGLCCSGNWLQVTGLLVSRHLLGGIFKDVVIKNRHWTFWYIKVRPYVRGLESAGNAGFRQSEKNGEPNFNFLVFLFIFYLFSISTLYSGQRCCLLGLSGRSVAPSISPLYNGQRCCLLGLSGRSVALTAHNQLAPRSWMTEL